MKGRHPVWGGADVPLIVGTIGGHLSIVPSMFVPLCNQTADATIRQVGDLPGLSFTKKAKTRHGYRMRDGP